MGGGFERRPGKSSLVHNDDSKVGTPTVGKRTLTEQFPQQPRPGPHPVEWLIHGPDGSATGDPVQRKVVDAGYADIVTAAATPVQRSAEQAGGTAGTGVQQVAAAGVAGGGSSLPHRERIQQLFGRHDISGVHAHVGGAAATASQTLGAKGYANGNHAAFRESPDLHTAAHEAAHVVQQRGGVQLKGGIDNPATHTSATPMRLRMPWSPPSRQHRCSTRCRAVARHKPPCSTHQRTPPRRRRVPATMRPR